MAEADPAADANANADQGDEQQADPKIQKAMQRMTALMEEFASIAREINPEFELHRVPDDPGAPISPDEIDRMCVGYFRYHEYIARGYIELAPDDLVAISDEIMEMTGHNPERLWPLLVELVERAPDDAVRSFVAAGALEELVKWHGERFLDRIERNVIQSKNFHSAMRGIWGWEGFSDDLRDRLFAVLTPDWEDLGERRAALT